MDPVHRNLILKCRDYLSRRIDLNKLRSSLEKHEIFTDAMLDDIYDYPSEYDFYVELTTRGPDAFYNFRQVLIEAGYLEESCLFEISSSNTREPDAIDKSLRSLGTTGYSQVHISETTHIARKQLCYRMTSKPLGYCMIINNVKFRHHSYREGSFVDAKKLKRLFEDIGYEVDVQNNLDASDMIAHLKKFREKDWSSVDSCVVFILSHGNNSQNLDIVFGSDSNSVKLIDIYNMFDNDNCESLKFKPKMFFISACRGEDIDYGGWTTVSSDAAKTVKIATFSDMFMVHSTLPNHESYRDHEKGTFFCQDLIEVFSCDYFTQDLDTMLKTVARRLESRVSDKMSKQVLDVRFSGAKATVYFSMEKVADICEIYNPQKALSLHSY